MAALGSQSIASSYEQLLHVDADGGGNSTTHVSVKDGDNGTTFGFTIASDALMMTSTNRLEFGDTGTYIHQSADGVLDLVSDTEIEINATTIDMNGAVDISGDTDIGGDVTLAAGKKMVVSWADTTNSSSYLAEFKNLDQTNNQSNGVLIQAGAGSSDKSLVVRKYDETEYFMVTGEGEIKVGAGDIVFSTAGKGICLGVTSNTDANTLDDYEEGDFTPQVSGDSGDATMHGSYKHGQYTKIGNLVHVNGYVIVSGTNSMGDNVKIDDLPFACNNAVKSSNAFSFVATSGMNLAAAGYNIAGNVNVNTTSILIWTWDITGGCTRLTEGEWSDGGELMFAGSYFTSG